MMTEPIIGITTYGRQETGFKSAYYDEYFASPALYVDAVRRAGGVPVLLPPGEAQWRSLLPRLDGIILSGGCDIHPDQYQGNGKHGALTRLDTERDASELHLVRHLTEQPDMPVLAICRGMQVLNVALGGTLYEHIPDVRDHDIHRHPGGYWTLQPVIVDAESRLGAILSTGEVEGYSGHHQAIKDIADGLQVAATAADGIVEALELPEHPWLIAVQWHPEMSAAQDPLQQRLFDELVGVAAGRRAENATRPGSARPRHE